MPMMKRFSIAASGYALTDVAASAPTETSVPEKSRKNWPIFKAFGEGEVVQKAREAFKNDMGTFMDTLKQEFKYEFDDKITKKVEEAMEAQANLETKWGRSDVKYENNSDSSFGYYSMFALNYLDRVLKEVKDQPWNDHGRFGVEIERAIHEKIDDYRLLYKGIGKCLRDMHYVWFYENHKDADRRWYPVDSDSMDEVHEKCSEGIYGAGANIMDQKRPRARGNWFREFIRRIINSVTGRQSRPVQGIEALLSELKKTEGDSSSASAKFLNGKRDEMLRWSSGY